MHGGKERAGKIVDLKGVEALRELRLTEEGLYLGALTTHRQVELWEELRGRFYALYQGCSQVGPEHTKSKSAQMRVISALI